MTHANAQCYIPFVHFIQFYLMPTYSVTRIPSEPETEKSIIEDDKDELQSTQVY